MATLSIIISNYNDSEIIESALSRLITQNRAADEIIVIDDGSTDDSLTRIERVSRANSKIRVLALTANVGTLEAIKMAYAQANSNYIYFAAADDGIGPQFVENILALAEKYPSAGLCCSDTAIRGRFRKTPVRHKFKNGFLSPSAMAAELKGQHIYSTGSIYRKDLIPEARMFDGALRWHADWFANMVLALRYGIAFLPEIHSFVTFRPNSFSNIGRNNWALQAGLIEHVFNLLNSSEYEDILPAFVRSNAMNHFGGGARRLLEERPDLMTDTNMLLAGDAHL